MVLLSNRAIFPKKYTDMVTEITLIFEGYFAVKKVTTPGNMC